MKLLVTGGCGFIGSHLVDKLVRLGNQVVVLDDLSSGRRDRLPPGVPLIEADVGSSDAVEAAMADVDGCFHLAAVASVPRTIEDWAHAHRTNLGGTVNVLSAARRPARGKPCPVVYASSAAVYGDPAIVPIDEAAPTRPLSPYGLDKLTGEYHAALMHDFAGVPSTGLRFFNVYGPRQDPSSPYSGVISRFVERAAIGQPLVIFGDGKQVRDFVHVEDVVEHLTAALVTGGKGARVFNVCTGRIVSIREVAELVVRVTGSGAAIEHREPRAGDIRVSVGKPRRAIEALGAIATVSLETGLGALIRTGAVALRRAA